LWKNPQVTYGTLCFAHDLLKSKPQVMEKSTRHLWNTLFCILQFVAQNHRSWKNPPSTCGTPCFVSSNSLHKTTGRGKIHLAPMEQTVLKLAFSEAKSTSCGRLHQALVEHAILRLTYSFQTCLHKQCTNPNV